MTFVRALLFAALAFLLAATGVAAAETRGQMAADGVICGTGSYAVVIAADGLPLFDGNGAPVEHGSLPCFDCTFAKFGPVPSDHAFAHTLEAGATLVGWPGPTLKRLPWIIGGHGRGPPGVV